MKDSSNGSQKGSQIAGILVLVAVCLVGFAFSPVLGVGVLLGVVAGAVALFLFRDVLRSSVQEKPQMQFVDTDALLESVPMPKNLPMPYAVLDMRGRILIKNEAFAAAFPTEDEAAKAVDRVLKAGITKEEPSSLEVGEKYYETYLASCDVLDESGAVGSVLTLTMVDLSHGKAWKQEREDQETVVATIFLDNYEEVLDSLEDSRVPILTALIERKLNQMATQCSGLLKKLEKDRYLFLLPQAKLEQMKGKKFEILTEIKEVTVGDHIPVTMSMGIGIGHGSLEVASQNAKAALDLALGRGGDQALIKDGEKFLFYGGKSGEISRNARVRARVKADALGELLEGADRIVVMGHTNADLDSLGSCLGICAMARAFEKPCQIVLDHESTPVHRLLERLRSAGQGGLFLKSQDVLKQITEKTLLVIVDTHRKAIVESPAVLDAAKRLVVIDHHRRSTDFIEQAVLVYHEPYASSTSELVSEMIRHMGGKINLKQYEADALLGGITVDTKNFCVNTGAITFEAAAFLRRHGADGIRVRLLFQNDMEVYRAKAYTIQNAEIYQGNLAISVCPSTSEDSLLTAAQAADELMNVTGIVASFVCCKLENAVHISARSFGEVNVQRVMEKLGGGGHLTVSGAQLADCSIEEAKEKIKQAITEYMEVESK